MLDVGPICGSNINFFLQRVRKLFVCDIYSHLDQARRKGLPLSRAWQQLGYPPQSLDGILLWELIDRLDDHELAEVVELCHKMMKPRGILMLLVPAEKVLGPGVYSFVIRKDFRLQLRHQPHLDLPSHRRHSRQVLTLLAPFTQIRSFIYRNGFKEFLFEHN